MWNVATDILINELLEQNFKIKMPVDCLKSTSLLKMGFASDEEDVNILSHTAEEIYSFMVERIVSITYEKGYVTIKFKTGKTVKYRTYGEMFDDEDLDERLKAKITEVIKDHKDAGSAAGSFLKSLSAIAGVSFPFEAILKKYFERKDYDFSRKNRRLKAEARFFRAGKTRPSKSTPRLTSQDRVSIIRKSSWPTL